MNAMSQRRAAVAGQFYPREPQRLREAVRHYIDGSEVPASPDNVVALLVPHAGFIYSGPTAGHAYARIAGMAPRRVILIGCSHRYAIATASVYSRGRFETPLGDFPVDAAFADAVTDAIGASSTEPHLFEHSLEVQLPFLAVQVGLVPIVPVLFGSPPRPWHAEAGRLLAAKAQEGDLLVVSTDLSHYMNEESANATDLQTVEAVLSRDWRAVIEPEEGDELPMCGSSAVVAAMAYADARGADDWRLLDYRTSAQASGDYSRVVGYAAISMERAA